MKFLLLSVLGLALAAHAAFVSNPALDAQWENFKAKYGKSYARGEELIRRENYEYNMAFISVHNKEYAAGLHSFTVAENHMADLSYEERKAMNGYRAPIRTVKPTAKITNAPQAAEVDFTNDPCLQPVKDQGQCGSCWAFSAIGTVEFESCKVTGNAVALSEQNLVDCSWKYGNLGCNGGFTGQAFKYIIDHNGVDTQESYPYHAVGGSCAFDVANIGATMTSFTDLSPDATTMAGALASGKILSVAIDASRLSFNFYNGGIYDDEACTTVTDHAVIAVGYGSENGVDYWIVRNSWGPAWGEAGYIRMRRGINLCAVEDYPQIVTI